MHTLDEYTRTRQVIGEAGLARIKSASVIVFGLGGVGSYTTEALARGGVGSLTLVDHDTVSVTNINRQLYALHSTLGKKKTDVARQRIRDINPDIKVDTCEVFYGTETAILFDLSKYDYCIDAIDTVTAKLLLIEQAKKAGVPILSSMGTGNKLDPAKFEICDIAKTSMCPLAKVIRSELRKRRIEKVKVLYSREVPVRNAADACETKGSAGRPAPGSVSFVPGVAGLMIAGEVIRELSGI